MALHTYSDRLNLFLHLLVTYRLRIYLGGLLVISAPVLLAMAFEIRLPSTARTVIIGTTLTAMITTYFAERRIDYSQINSVSGEQSNEYPLRMRIAIGLSIIGVAAGIYIALEGNSLVGLIFIAGAYLFGYLAYHGKSNPSND